MIVGVVVECDNDNINHPRSTVLTQLFAYIGCFMVEVYTSRAPVLGYDS